MAGDTGRGRRREQPQQPMWKSNSLKGRYGLPWRGLVTHLALTQLMVPSGSRPRRSCSLNSCHRHLTSRHVLGRRPRSVHHSAPCCTHFLTSSSTDVGHAVARTDMAERQRGKAGQTPVCRRVSACLPGKERRCEIKHKHPRPPHAWCFLEVLMWVMVASEWISGLDFIQEEWEAAHGHLHALRPRQG